MSRRPSPGSAPRPDYLSRLADDVAAGLALIVHDVVATGALPAPRAEVAVRVRAAEHLEFLRAEDLPVSARQAAVWVAEALQGDLIEGLGTSPRLVTWPSCPDHPNHPLWLEQDRGRDAQQRENLADEMWTCPTTRRAVAELGGL